MPFPKRFTVFDIAQCEGLPEDLTVAAPSSDPGLIESTVGALIKAAGIGFPSAAAAPSICPRKTMCRSRRRILL